MQWGTDESLHKTCCYCKNIRLYEKKSRGRVWTIITESVRASLTCVWEASRAPAAAGAVSAAQDRDAAEAAGFGHGGLQVEVGAVWISAAPRPRLWILGLVLWAALEAVPRPTVLQPAPGTPDSFRGTDSTHLKSSDTRDAHNHLKICRLCWMLLHTSSSWILEHMSLITFMHLTEAFIQSSLHVFSSCIRTHDPGVARDMIWCELQELFTLTSNTVCHPFTPIMWAETCIVFQVHV